MYTMNTNEDFYKEAGLKSNTIYILDISGYSDDVIGILISNAHDYFSYDDDDADYDYAIFDLEDGNIYPVKKDNIYNVREWHGTITQ